MSFKQDLNGTRTAQDIEKKYNLAGIQKAVKQSAEGIAKTNTILEGFMNSTLQNIDNLQEEIDGKVITYYYSGEPSLSTSPANEWPEADYEKHEGNLYYDKDTGYSYVFENIEGVYQWVLIENKDVTEALALANSALDTADNKRRVFVDTPFPPYDNGDLYFIDGEIFICQITKAEGEEYDENDFITAVKYTDDTKATQVGEQLEVVKGQVLTVKEGVDEFKITFDSTIKTVNELQQETTEALETMSYSFGTKDLTIANSNDPVNARFNNQGVRVYSYTDLQLIANHLGVGANKLIVVGDSQIANLKITKAVDENGNGCTDFHHLISNIQELEDLEV